MAYRGKNKFFAHKVEWDGIKFDSTLERDRYKFLLYMQEQGKIRNLTRQMPFEIIPKQTETITKQLKTKVKYEERTLEQAAIYTADFVYELDGKVIVEDTKSEYTRKEKDYVLRRKLMLYHNNIRIVEVCYPSAPCGEHLEKPKKKSKKKTKTKKASPDESWGLFD